MSKHPLRIYGLLLLLAGSSLTASCGNTNRLYGGDDDAGDTDFIKAQSAYDNGNFYVADTLASKLVAKNPNDERASILLGFTHLSEGGIDPFVLARELIAIGASTGSTTTSNSGGSLTLSSTTEQDSGTGSGTSASSVSNLLSNLKVLVNLSSSDENALIAHQFGPADVSSTTTSLNLFVGSNALVVPNDVTNALRAQVDVLNHMNLAVNDVCPFVDSDVIVAEDNRQSCTSTTYTRNFADQAHFLWAFSHLVEAVAFQNILLYVAPGNTQPSIDAVNSNLNQITSVTSVSALQTLVQDVQEVSAAINKVLNTTDANSMVEATLTDLNVTVLAFGKLAGMPASIQQSVTSAFNDITSLSKTVAGGTSALNNAKAFKTQISTTLAQTVASKIQTAASSAGVSTAQKTQMCNAYASLIADAPSGSTLASSTPAACK